MDKLKANQFFFFQLCVMLLFFLIFDSIIRGPMVEVDKKLKSIDWMTYDTYKKIKEIEVESNIIIDYVVQIDSRSRATMRNVEEISRAIDFKCRGF